MRNLELKDTSSINIRLLAHQIGLGTAGTARQWLLDPTTK